MSPTRLTLAALTALCLIAPAAFAHAIGGSDAEFVRNTVGADPFPFLYLGAKHMVTGYDHLLFLFGVIFFLYRMKEVGLYVTLFAVGHSLTLLIGVLGGLHVNAHLVDAIIGLSVVYKALDNLGAFQRLFGRSPDNRVAVLIFGLFHGFGLATKLQDVQLSRDGLLVNMLAFNLGVELGQLLALTGILLLMGFWRRWPAFARHALDANAALMCAGFILVGYQLTGYVVQT